MRVSSACAPVPIRLWFQCWQVFITCKWKRACIFHHSGEERHWGVETPLCSDGMDQVLWASAMRRKDVCAWGGVRAAFNWHLVSTGSHWCSTIKVQAPYDALRVLVNGLSSRYILIKELSLLALKNVFDWHECGCTYVPAWVYCSS